MNSTNKFAALVLAAFVAMPIVAKNDKDADKKTDKKEKKQEVLFKANRLQYESNRDKNVKEFVKNLSVDELKEGIAQIKKVKAALKSAKEVSNWNKLSKNYEDFKVIDAEKQEKLKIKDQNNWNIHLMATHDLPIYESRLKELQKNEPLKTKIRNKEWLKAVLWADRSALSKAAIATGAVVGTGLVAYGVKQAVYPATRGEKNIKALDDLVERADRAEAGNVSALDQDAFEHILLQLTLVSQESLIQIATLVNQGQYAELINFVEGSVRNEVANHPAADKRDGIFSRFSHKEEDFAQAE